MNTFAAFETFLGSRSARRVAKIRSTRIERRSNDSIAVVYHSTDVVTAHRDGSFTLNTGGHFTRTTKERINDFSPAHLYQQNFTWRHLVGGLRFQDRQRVDAAGQPVVGTCWCGCGSAQHHQTDVEN